MIPNGFQFSLIKSNLMRLYRINYVFPTWVWSVQLLKDLFSRKMKGVRLFVTILSFFHVFRLGMRPRKFALVIGHSSMAWLSLNRCMIGWVNRVGQPVVGWNIANIPNIYNIYTIHTKWLPKRSQTWQHTHWGPLRGPQRVGWIVWAAFGQPFCIVYIL